MKQVCWMVAVYRQGGSHHSRCSGIKPVRQMASARQRASLVPGGGACTAPTRSLGGSGGGSVGGGSRPPRPLARDLLDRADELRPGVQGARGDPFLANVLVNQRRLLEGDPQGGGGIGLADAVVE